VRRKRSMKEITRRLYTKPVMLGMSMLVGIVLLAGLFVMTKSAAAVTGIPEGNDLFETTGNGETYHNFQASPIDAHFFGPNSEQFKGVVPLVGVPLPDRLDDIDTIIHRNGCPATPCTMGIQMTALNLKSIAPITVTYSDDTPDESWEVYVGLSIHTGSTGTMTFNSGGSFDSSLKVWPRFTFKRIPDQTTLVWDTGGPAGPGLTAQSSASDGAVFEPVPEPTVAPCAQIDDFESRVSAAATASCAPVTLTATNTPWPITRPLTEQELLASHNASPPGTKKKIAQAKIVGIQ
jgi:hypothetical protein